VEDRWAVGVLDLILKLPGHPMVLGEGKIIDGYKFAPTERQWLEGHHWINAGVDCVLIGWKGKTMSISPWVPQADCRFCHTGQNSVETLMEYLRNGREGQRTI
jgi:hypothetical protein